MAESIVLAFDLGGTDLKGARVTRAGEVRGFRKAPSRAADGPAALIAAVHEMADALGGPAGPAIAGLGCPGVIDARTGTLLGTTPHLVLPPDFPLAGRLATSLGLRVVVDNDAHCAALAESMLGAAKGSSVSMTVTVGTGVGCGIVLDGRVFHGAHGGAGEIGHLPLGGTGPACRCGVPGCLEPWSGGAGLAARAREAGVDAADARAVFESHHPQAHAVRTQAIESLARQLAAAAAVLDPEVIVIGGGVSLAGEALLGPLRRAFDRFVPEAQRSRVRLVASALGEQSGVVGAGLAAWEAMKGTR